MTRHPNPRVAAARVDALFIDRWSPRSFSPEPLTDADIASMFEAARWAPSSSNVQPWRFLYETDGPDREVFDSILNPRNREWASKAPFLGFLFANTRPAGSARRGRCRRRCASASGRRTTASRPGR